MFCFLYKLQWIWITVILSLPLNSVPTLSVKERKEKWVINQASHMDTSSLYVAVQNRMRATGPGSVWYQIFLEPRDTYRADRELFHSL